MSAQVSTPEFENLVHQARRATTRVEVAPTDIRAERILRMHGYKDMAGVRRRVRAIALEMATLADAVVQPCVTIRCSRVTRVVPGTVAFADGVVLQCEAFDHYLRGCDEVVLFVLSAGAQFDARVAQLMHDDRCVDALFLNTAGWLCVEAITRGLVDALKIAALADGLRLTRRLGPGYGYRVNGLQSHWPLEQQHTLFALIGMDSMGVQVLDSGGMQPQMSRSGLFGLRQGMAGDTECAAAVSSHQDL